MWNSIALTASALVLFVSALIAEQLPIQTYTTAEGLVHNHINRIRQDRHGFLWLCTDGGLTRFDGSEFVSYTTQDGIPHPWVNDFLEARDGTYWVATDGGVVKFDPAGTSPHMADRRRRDAGAAPLFVGIGPEGPAGARRVNALAEDRDGSILCATYAGLYRLERSSARLSFDHIEIGLPKGVIEGGLVNNLSTSRQGGWWIATRYGLFHLSTEGRAERITSAQGLPDNFVETVYEDRAGRVWAGTRTGGFCEVRSTPSTEGGVVERCYSVRDGLPDNDVRSILQSADGEFWIGTAGGLTEFHPSSRVPRFRNYTVAHGLSDSHILKLFEDSDGNLWVGTALSGIMKMIRQGFTSFDSRDGFLSGVNHQSILETVAGELSIVSEVGGKVIVQVLKRGRFHPVDANLPIVGEGNPARSGSLQDRNGEWWIGTEHGLFRFPKAPQARALARTRVKAIFTAADGFAGDNVASLYEDSHGDIWISTNSVSAHSLSRWSRSTGKLQHYTEALPLLKGKRASAFGEDSSGNIWIGLVDSGGIVRYRHGRFAAVPAADGTFSGIVESIYADHAGRMWVATNQAGLTRIDDTDLDSPHIQRYSEAEGLSSNDVSCIAEDESGQIYAGTNRGVDRLDPVSGRIRRFTAADGLLRGAILLAHRDREGMLWFVSNNGVSRLAPAQIKPQSAPPVLIRRLRIFGESYPISEVGETALSGIVVPPERNALQIEFVSPDFRPGLSLQYQYRLEGTGLDWSLPSGNRSVQFASLPAGYYRFLVRAVSSTAAGAPAIVSFRVVPPFWRQWWFLIAVAILTAGGLYALHWMRLRQATEIERVRTRIATDLHDDIGSSLSQIAILSEVVSRNLEGAERTEKEFLSQIAGASRELIHSMSDIVWAINPDKDFLQDLMQRMRRFASDVFTARRIDFQFSGPQTEAVIRVGADVRRQVFLIFKESVNNAVRHSSCTRVDVDFAVERHWLSMKLRDNGKGLKISECVAGHGLASIRARAEALGGTIEVRSGQGTEIALRVPLSRFPQRKVKHSYPNG